MDGLLFLLSFAVGILIGLTGMGGAALMTPALILLFGVRPMVAVGTDLVYTALTKIVGSWAHHRHGSVDFKVVLQLSCGSLPFGLLGAWIIVQLPNAVPITERYVQRGIGGALLLVATTLLFQSFQSRVSESLQISKCNWRNLTLGWGAATGCIVGLTSVGAGSLVAPLLIFRFRTFPTVAVGTDIAHAAVLALSTGLIYCWGDSVDWNMIPMLLAGSIPGVVTGSYIATLVPVMTLRLILSLMLIATGLSLLLR